MTSRLIQSTISFARLLRTAGAKILLLTQAAILTPVLQLSAEPTSITIEIQKPMDQMWPDFDSSQESLMLFINHLEKTAHRFQEDERIDPLALEELRQLVIRLAQFGVSESSCETSHALFHDIIDLLTDEEEESDPDFIWENTACFSDTLAELGYYSADELAYLRCGFWKSTKKAVKRCAHKVEKFIRHHKKEILIGVGAVVIVGGVVYLAGACAVEGAAAAGAAAAASSDSKKKSSESSEKQSHHEVSSTESQVIKQVTHLKDALISEQVNSYEDALNKEDSLDLEFMDYVRLTSAKVAHDIWREIGKTGTLVLEIEEVIGKFGPATLPDELMTILRREGELFTSIDQTQENWKNHVARGHQKIDEWFHQSVPYNEELQTRLEEKYTTGTLPFPIGGNQKLLSDIKKASQLANLVRSTQAGTTISEEISVMSGFVA